MKTKTEYITSCMGDYINHEIVAEWKKGSIEFVIVRLWHDTKGLSPMMQDFLDWRCGYCIFPEQPTWINETNIEKVNVYGGVTRWEPLPDGSYMFGFDTQHGEIVNIERLKNVDWLRAECEKMADGILALTDKKTR